MDHGWRHQWLVMHFSGDLEINDFGFLSRPDLNYGHYEVKEAHYRHPRPNRSTLRTTGAGASAAATTTPACNLQRQFRMSVSEPAPRDGGNSLRADQPTAKGHYDRILRGNGILTTPGNFNAFAERNWTRKGAWAFYGEPRPERSGIGNEQNERHLGGNAQVPTLRTSSPTT